MPGFSDPEKRDLSDEERKERLKEVHDRDE